MVAAETLQALIAACRNAVRVTQRCADVLRADANVAQAAMLESVATVLARAAHDADLSYSDEALARLLALAGKTVRAMHAAAEPLAHHVAVVEELRATADQLAAALHAAGEQTVPILVEDVLEEK